MSMCMSMPEQRHSRLLTPGMHVACRADQSAVASLLSVPEALQEFSITNARATHAEVSSLPDRRYGSCIFMLQDASCRACWC